MARDLIAEDGSADLLMLFFDHGKRFPDFLRGVEPAPNSFQWHPPGSSVSQEFNFNRICHVHAQVELRLSGLQGSRHKEGLCCVRACVCDACVLVSVQALATRPT